MQKDTDLTQSDGYIINYLNIQSKPPISMELSK